MKDHFEDDLDPALLDAARRARKQGRIDDAALEDFYRRVQGFLSDEQARRLRALVDKLKAGQ